MVTRHGETWGRGGREIRNRSSCIAALGTAIATMPSNQKNCANGSLLRTVALSKSSTTSLGTSARSEATTSGRLMDSSWTKGSTRCETSSDLVAKSWRIRVVLHAASTVVDKSPLHQQSGTPEAQDQHPFQRSAKALLHPSKTRHRNYRWCTHHFRAGWRDRGMCTNVQLHRKGGGLMTSSDLCGSSKRPGEVAVT